MYDRTETAPGVTSFYMKVLAAIGLMGVAGLGGSVGSLIVNKRYPIQALERSNLTPSIKPGDNMLLAQHVTRLDQCDVVIKRTVKTSTGQRIFIKQEFDEGFGPLGTDRYILPIEMPAGAALGPAEMYSKAYSYCNWLDSIKPSEADRPDRAHPPRQPWWRTHHGSHPVRSRGWRHRLDPVPGEDRGRGAASTAGRRCPGQDPQAVSRLDDAVRAWSYARRSR